MKRQCIRYLRDLKVCLWGGQSKLQNADAVPQEGRGQPAARLPKVPHQPSTTALSPGYSSQSAETRPYLSILDAERSHARNVLGLIKVAFKGSPSKVRRTTWCRCEH